MNYIYVKTRPLIAQCAPHTLGTSSTDTLLQMLFAASVRTFTVLYQIFAYTGNDVAPLQAVH